MVNKWMILVVVLLLFIGCGTMPPGKFWDGSREDSLAIQDSIMAMRSRAETEWFFKSDYVLGGDFTPFTVPRDIIKKALDDTFSQDFFPVAFQMVALQVDTVDSLTFAKDTTCTVSVILRIKKGELRVRCDSMTPVKDTIIIGGNPTIVYAKNFIPKETTLVKDLHGEAWRSAFFDYDAVSHGWQLKRVSGGLDFWFPDVSTAPFIPHYIILTKPSAADTIYWRPDTLHYGIRRLYPLDSLLTYSVGETLRISNFTAYVYADSVTFLWIDSTRYASYEPIVFSNPGLHMISFEVANAEPFYSPKPSATYRSILWGIPVLVK